MCVITFSIMFDVWGLISLLCLLQKGWLSHSLNTTCCSFICSVKSSLTTFLRRRFSQKIHSGWNSRCCCCVSAPPSVDTMTLSPSTDRGDLKKQVEPSPKEMFGHVSVKVHFSLYYAKKKNYDINCRCLMVETDTSAQSNHQ